MILLIEVLYLPLWPHQLALLALSVNHNLPPILQILQDEHCAFTKDEKVLIRVSLLKDRVKRSSQRSVCHQLSHDIA